MLRLIDCIEAVAFDLDGTLLDTAPDLAAAADMMLEILGGRPVPPDCIPGFIGGGIDRLVARVIEESRASAPLDPALHAAAATLFRNLYGQRLFERGRVYPGVIETLRTLAQAAIPSCCVTNKESRFALPLIEAAGLGARIALTLCADRPEDRKPNPNLLLAACAGMRVQPAQLLYVGDCVADIIAARAAGCRVVAVNYGYTHHFALADARPDGVVGDLTEIMTIGVRPRPGVPTLRAVS